jgi:hypothetical protein
LIRIDLDSDLFGFGLIWIRIDLDSDSFGSSETPYSDLVKYFLLTAAFQKCLGRYVGIGHLLTA